MVMKEGVSLFSKKFQMISMNIQIMNHQNIANLSKDILELKDGAFVLDSYFDSLVLESLLADWSKAKKTNIKALSSRNLHSSREDKLQKQDCIKHFKVFTRSKCNFSNGKVKKGGNKLLLPC